MSRLNPSIILAGQQPDLVNAFGRGQELRARQDQMQHQNALRGVYQSHGEGILSGNPEAMNVLAQIDPGQAVQIRGQHDLQRQRRQKEQFDMQAMEMRVQEHIAGKEAAEIDRDLQFLRQGLAQATVLAERGDIDGINGILRQVGHPDIGSMDEFEEVLAKYSNSEKIMSAYLDQTPEDPNYSNFKVVGNQLYDLATEGGPSVVGSSQQTPGFSVTTPDGTTVQHGWQGSPAPGQNPSTTGTPRDPGKLSSELSKKDAAALEEINNAARNATDIESLATQLETIAPQVGYTGPGGQVYGFIDDAVGFLPGDSGARGAFKSLGLEAQLTFTEKTTGAITDREMGMFKAAVPNLNQTQEGNTSIAQVMKAGAARIQARAAFFENWARKNGSLEGAQEVWSEYMRDNPLITEDGNGIKANPEGDWQSYLNRQPAMSYTPQSIMQMDRAAVGQVPIEKLTGPQLDALEQRMQELGL